MDRSEGHPAAITTINDVTAPRGLLIPLTAVAVLLVLANIVVANHVYRQKRADYWTVVSSVAELRSQQVSEWLEERLQSAALHATSFPQAELYERWRTGGDESARDRLFLRLRQFAESGRFKSVLLFDADGNLLSGRQGARSHLRAERLADVIGSAASAAAAYVGPYRGQDGRAHLDFVTTLPVDGSAGKPVVLLHTDAEDFFPEAMRSFPLPTDSGEVILFRIEGREAVALSELRHVEGSAFRRFSLDHSPRRLATQLASAAWTDQSRIDGVDYRGVAVFGADRPIRGTDWHLVAKMDVGEVRQAALRSMLPIVLLSLLLFLAIAATLVNRRQRQRLLQARAVQQDQRERLEALQLLKAVADSADDAIFVKNLEGRYLLFNRAACELTGKSDEEVLGQDDSTLFPPDRAALLGDVHRRVLAENQTIMTREALDTTIGTRVVLTKNGPLHDESGRLIGVYGISCDVTELERSTALLEQHDRRLEERNQELERFNEAMVGRELDMRGLKQQVNELSMQLGLEPPFARELGAFQEDD